MGFDLQPRNRDLDWFHLNIWGWAELMKDVGCGKAIDLTFIDDGNIRYVPDKKGNSPMLNDGFYVNAQQAREMANITTRWLIDWEEKTQPAPMPSDERWRKKLLDFCHFAENSRGFWVR